MSLSDSPLSLQKVIASAAFISERSLSIAFVSLTVLTTYNTNKTTTMTATTTIAVMRSVLFFLFTGLLFFLTILNFDCIENI